MADAVDPADPLQRRAADQHAAAGRCRRAALRIGDPARRAQHEEEEHEGRDQQSLPRGPAIEPHHQRGEVVVAALGARDERREVVRRVDDIGIGQQQVIGFAGPGGGGDALAHRPQFAGPARRHRPGGDDGQPVGGAGPHRRVLRRGGGAVVAVVVHDDNMQRSGIMLRQQRGDGAADHLRLVARRDHGDDRAGRRRCGGDRIIVHPPEQAAAGNQAEPSRSRCDADDRRNHPFLLMRSVPYQ